MRITFYGNTDLGRQRDHNEDSFMILFDNNGTWQEVKSMDAEIEGTRGIIFAVADGMGGANAGEIASALAILTVKDMTKKITSLSGDVQDIQEFMRSVIFEGHERIVKAARRKKGAEGMGTTLVLGWIQKDSLFVSWSGDSRCYVYSRKTDAELKPFTDDHSLVWERVKNGEITAEEARLNEHSNLILQSLGGALQKPDPEFRWIRLNKNDRILFCSDGLNSMLSNTGIQQILDFNSSAEETCESLIRSSNNAGGRDNITAIVIDVLEENQEFGGKSGSYFAGTGKVHKLKTNTGKRNKITLITLIFIGLIATSVIIFRKEVKSFFVPAVKIENGSYKNEGKTPADNNKPQAKNDSGITAAPLAGNSKPDSVSTKTKKNKESLKGSKQVPNADSIKIHLNKALLKIEDLKTRINRCNPNDPDNQHGEESVQFYEKNKPTFDSIISQLDVQKSQITRIVKVNSDKTIQVLDTLEAKRIYIKIDSELTALGKRFQKLYERNEK